MVYEVKVLETISDCLSSELPGLRGFTSRNLRYMGTFYEEWKMLDTSRISNQSRKADPMSLELVNSKIEIVSFEPIWNLQVPNYQDFPLEEFFHIGFTHHRVILSTVKTLEERLYYIRRCSKENFTVDALKKSISSDDFHHKGALPNNFVHTISKGQQALRAITTFKDEYLLDFINVEELDVRDKTNVDEKMVENAIIHNIKNFIMTFGKDFAFVQNQYHLDAFWGRSVYRSAFLQQRAELSCGS